jgi:hypothetical protein
MRIAKQQQQQQSIELYGETQSIRSRLVSSRQRSVIPVSQLLSLLTTSYPKFWSRLKKARQFSKNTRNDRMYVPVGCGSVRLFCCCHVADQLWLCTCVMLVDFVVKGVLLRVISYHIIIIKRLFSEDRYQQILVLCMFCCANPLLCVD